MRERNTGGFYGRLADKMWVKVHTLPTGGNNNLCLLFQKTTLLTQATNVTPMVASEHETWIGHVKDLTGTTTVQVNHVMTFYRRQQHMTERLP